MSDKKQGKVLKACFGSNTETRSVRGEWCPHGGSYEVNRDQRTVKCVACGALMDPFKIILDYADGERTYMSWKARRAELGKELDALRAEEKRVKARTKSHSRKDAQKAVADARKRWEEDLTRAQWDLKQIHEAAERVERAVGLAPKRKRSRRAPVQVHSVKIDESPPKSVARCLAAQEEKS